MLQAFIDDKRKPTVGDTAEQPKLKAMHSCRGLKLFWKSQCLIQQKSLYTDGLVFFSKAWGPFERKVGELGGKVGEIENY